MHAWDQQSVRTISDEALSFLSGTKLNVDREVLFIEVSLKYYPEDITVEYLCYSIENKVF